MPYRPGPIQLAAFAAAYFVAAKISLLTVMPGGVAIIWLPAAVLLAALILFDRRASVLLAIIAIVAESIAGVGHGPMADGLMLGIISAGEALIAAAILRRFRFDPSEMTIRDAASFALAAPLLASAAGAVVWSFYRGTEGTALEIFRIRWCADALGLIVLTPALLAPGLRGSGSSSAQRGWNLWDSVLALGLAATLMFTGGGGIASGPGGGPFLAFPLMIALAARATPRSTALVAAAVATILVTMIQLGIHPFGDVGIRTAVIKAQQFLFVTAIVSQGLTAMLTQIRHKSAEIEHLNSDLEARVKARTAELEFALSQVRQLQGLVPICAWGKRGRVDKDSWHSVEQYIEARTDAQFSHGICPSCYDEQLKDVAALAQAGRAEAGD